MTIGDIIEAIRRLFGGKSPDERKLAEYDRQIKDLEELNPSQQKKCDTLAEDIARKTEALRVAVAAKESRERLQLLMSEVENLKKDFARQNKTSQEIIQKLNTLKALKADLERKIQHVRTNISVDDVQRAQEGAKEREVENAAMAAEVDKLEAPSGQETSGADFDARMAALLGDAASAATAAPAAASAAPAAAAAPAPAEAPAAPAAGVVVAG